jgi:predicted phage terminase large subunit-like protein
MAEAQSEVQRKRVIDWYRGTVYNRLQPGGAIVLINHRMHEEDLSGFLLAQALDGGDQWRVVELPAICDSKDDLLGRKVGEALWPEWYPLERLERIKRVSMARDWSALYLQKPAPEDGTFFRADWFKPYRFGDLPDKATLSIYGASDFAVSEAKGDYTVHVVVGLDSRGNMWLLDMWREQASSDKWVESWCDLVLKWKPLAWASEKGPIDSGVGPFLTQRAMERKACCTIEKFTTAIGNKEIRAQSIRGKMALEGLLVPEYASWWPDFRRELLSFPAGKHDDQVDAMAWVGLLLDEMVRGRNPKKVEPDKRDPYREWGDQSPEKFHSILTL